MKTPYYLFAITLVGASACGDDDGTPSDADTSEDVGQDSSADVGEDVAPDATMDAAADAGSDVELDTVADTALDVEPDGAQDISDDVSDDAGDANDAGGTNDTGVEPTGPLLRFHVAHLVDGIGALDVFTSLVSTPFYADLPFGESTGVVVAVGGDASVVFRAQDSEYEVSVSGEFAFGGDDQYTVGAIGNADAPLALLIREDSSSPPNDAVRYRYAHASSALSESVNLWLANEGEPDDTFIEDLGFGDVSNDATRAAGPHRISIDLEKDGVPDVFFDMGSLVSSAQYTFWISSDAAGAFILITDTEGGSTRIDGAPIE